VLSLLSLASPWLFTFKVPAQCSSFEGTDSRIEKVPDEQGAFSMVRDSSQENKKNNNFAKLVFFGSYSSGGVMSMIGLPRGASWARHDLSRAEKRLRRPELRRHGFFPSRLFDAHRNGKPSPRAPSTGRLNLINVNGTLSVRRGGPSLLHRVLDERINEKNQRSKKEKKRW
jgi:hypothetical protein